MNRFDHLAIMSAIFVSQGLTTVQAFDMADTILEELRVRFIEEEEEHKRHSEG